MGRMGPRQSLAPPRRMGMLAPAMRSFFPMPLGDLLYLVVLIAFAVVAFLPWARDIEWGGMALVGWLMALLMVLSPAIALIRMARERRQPAPAEDAKPPDEAAP